MNIIIIIIYYSMEKLETFEAKLLYKVYMLYKNNIINSY